MGEISRGVLRRIFCTSTSMIRHYQVSDGTIRDSPLRLNMPRPSSIVWESENTKDVHEFEYIPK